MIDIRHVRMWTIADIVTDDVYSCRILISSGVNSRF